MTQLNLWVMQRLESSAWYHLHYLLHIDWDTATYTMLPLVQVSEAAGCSESAPCEFSPGHVRVSKTANSITSVAASSHGWGCHEPTSSCPSGA